MRVSLETVQIVNELPAEFEPSRPRVLSRAIRVEVGARNDIPGQQVLPKSRLLATRLRRSTSLGSMRERSGLARGLAAYFGHNYFKKSWKIRRLAS